MGKRQQKKTAGWTTVAVGVAVSVGIYLVGMFLLALLMVKGVFPSEKEMVLLSVWAMLSAACGSLPVLKVKMIVPALACLIQGAGFVALIVTISYLFWEGPVWCGGNAILLLCAVLGGLLPGLVIRGKRRGKRKRVW